MKESIFNAYFTADDGAKLAFNSFSCGLAVVDETYTELLSQIKDITPDTVPSELKDCFEAAVAGHFIVEDDYDELAELSVKRSLQKYSTDSLGLTIAPTLACNFKCIYCYETSKPGLMSTEICNSIIKYVEDQASRLQNLSISWYGGEPLLAQNLIWQLSEAFMKICEEHQIEYDAFMISNGSLIDDCVIQKMIKYQIRGIQITIDGPPDVHNRRRVNKAGDDTFDLLIENINRMLETDKIEVVIRINVDKSNQQDVESLIAILASRLSSKNIRISFGQVSAYTEACKNIENTCYDNGEFALELIKYQGVLEKYGFADANPFPYPEVKLNYCCAELLNSFVVDHEGYLYKCWNEVGNTERSIGNITDSEFDITNWKNGKWITRNPFENETCKKCNLLPICMGGCPHHDTVLGKKATCDLIKYNIQDVMLKYYNMLKENVQ